MPLILALTLILVTPAAYATGSPSVLYWMGGELLAFVAGVVWVIIAVKPWVAKRRAMASLFLGLILVVLLHVTPDYLARQYWIEGISILLLVLTFVIAVTVLRRG